MCFLLVWRVRILFSVVILIIFKQNVCMCVRRGVVCCLQPGGQTYHHAYRGRSNWSQGRVMKRLCYSGWQLYNADQLHHQRRKPLWKKKDCSFRVMSFCVEIHLYSHFSSSVTWGWSSDDKVKIWLFMFLFFTLVAGLFLIFCRSLKQLCRARIFRCLHLYAPHKAEKLPLPDSLKRYLTFPEHIKDKFYEEKPLSEEECPYDCGVVCPLKMCPVVDISFSDDSDQDIEVWWGGWHWLAVLNPSGCRPQQCTWLHQTQFLASHFTSFLVIPFSFLSPFEATSTLFSGGLFSSCFLGSTQVLIIQWRPAAFWECGPSWSSPYPLGYLGDDRLSRGSLLYVCIAAVLQPPDQQFPRLLLMMAWNLVDVVVLTLMTISWPGWSDDDDRVMTRWMWWF